MPDKVDEDLVFLLQNCSLSDVKEKAWEYVLGLTNTDDGLAHLLSTGIYLPCIVTHVLGTTSNSESRKIAHKCLINITSNPNCASKLLLTHQDFVLQLLHFVCDPDTEYPDEKCYVLSNLSAHCDLLDCEKVAAEFPHLLKKVLMYFCANDSEVREQYKFLAFVFGNISKQPMGRRILIDDDAFLNSVLICLNPSESLIRRLGIALALQNCCSETAFHPHLLEEAGLLPSLLLPLVGPEEYDDDEMEKLPLECQYMESTKEREKNPQVRRALVQALSLLCYTEEGWKHLKSKGVYYIARELHLCEKDPDVIEAIETLVGYLLVDNYSVPDAVDPSLPAPEVTEELKDVPDIVL